MNILAMLSLQLAISVPCCLLIIFYWTIPESPRWLVSKNRIKVSSSSFLFCEIFRNSSLSQICGELNHFGKIRRLLKSWSRQQQQMETRFLEMTRCPIDWLMWTSNYNFLLLQSSLSYFQMTEALKSLYVPEDTVAAISTGDKLKEAFSEVTVSGDYEIENVEAFIVDNCKRVFQYSQK